MCKSSLCHSLIKVDVELGWAVLVAHHEGLLQFLEVLSIQHLVPLAEALPLQLVQNMNHLAVGEEHLLAVECLG